MLKATIKQSITVTAPTVKDTQQTGSSTLEDCGSKSSTSKRGRNRKKPEKQKCDERKVELGRKKKIKWPKSNSDEWQKLDTDLTMILREVGKTPEAMQIYTQTSSTG